MSDESKVSVKSILKAATARDVGEFSVGGIKYPTMSTTSKRDTQQSVSVVSQPKEASPKEIIALVKTIDRLKKEVESVRKEGEGKAQQARGQGIAEGRAQGLAEGKREASVEYHSQLNSLKGNLANVFAVLSQEKNFFFAEAEQGAVRIASSIALKFIEHLTENSKEVITHSVKKGIQALGNETNLIVKVNPDDFDAVEDDVEFWKPVQSSLKDIKVVEDARISRGGCLLETESGTVDVSVDMVIKGIEETLNMSLKHFGLADTKMSDEAKELHERNLEQTQLETTMEEHVGKVDSAMQHAYDQLEVESEEHLEEEQKESITLEDDASDDSQQDLEEPEQ